MDIIKGVDHCKHEHGKNGGKMFKDMIDKHEHADSMY